MPTPEFTALKVVLSQANTAAARRQAGGALQTYLSLHPESETTVLTSMGVNKGYPAQIPLNSLPSVLEDNPATFDRLKEFITRWNG